MAETQTKREINQDFLKAFSQLNGEQKKAVELIDGPVLVLAGPGTGKTQILALRIGQILQKTDAQAQNILCLTYTDAGAINMRKRLLQFIGPEAYKVQVHTFHSFCNEVIQDNQEYFSSYLTLHHVSDLEKATMLHDLIDQLPLDNLLRRLKGELYHEASRLDALFSLMKRESWSPSFLQAKIDAFKKHLEEDPGSIAKSGKNKGKLRQDVQRKLKQMDLLTAAVGQFDPFQSMMKDAGRYDFDDMIHWVVNGFADHEDLLAHYQEKFLYILVDEYQDTNGTQNRIIQQLSDFWDEPNLFVVGDDDQAIFRFQGANMKGIEDHRQKFDPSIIVLRENYRSSQHILDAAHLLISKSGDSLAHRLALDKDLTAHGQHAASEVKPQVLEYINVTQEEAGTVATIQELIAQGENPNEIAVIYRKHSQAENLIKVLSQKGIGVNVKQKINILTEPLINNLRAILTYIQSQHDRPGSRDDLLFQIMHYRFFDIEARDLAKLSISLRKAAGTKKSLRSALNEDDFLESLKLINVQALITFRDLVYGWSKDLPHVTIQILLERILRYGNVFREIMLSTRRTYEMQTLATFFNYLKEESRRQPGLLLSAFLEQLQEMDDIKLPLPMQSLIRSRDGINFLTAHGAKGLEFGHVFMIGCNEANWKNRGGYNRQYRLPDNLTDPTADADTDDERRLFYVAMTRAKHHLSISFAAERLGGMPDEPSQFIAEAMLAHGTPPIEKVVLEKTLVDHYENLLKPADKNLPLLDHDLIDRVLDKFKLSSTALNTYIECPRTFYFDNILRVPLAQSPYLGYGNAVHNALQRALEAYGSGTPFSAEKLIEYFDHEMERSAGHFNKTQFVTYRANGRKVLPEFLDRIKSHWEACKKLDAEKSVNTAEHEGVPLTGRIDLIEHLADGRYRIVDFKTGKHDFKKLKPPVKIPVNPEDDPGGKFWRQIVFYKIMLRAAADPIPMDEGSMTFVEPDNNGKWREETFLIDFGQEEIVSKQIVDSWQGIQSHNFNQDCKRDICFWCNFVKNEYTISDEVKEEEHDETSPAMTSEPDEISDAPMAGQLNFNF